MKKDTFRHKLFPLIWIVSFFLVLFILSRLIPTDDLLIGRGFSQELTGDWLLVEENGAAASIRLPADLDRQVGDRVRIDYVFDQDYPDGVMLQIRASMQAVSVLLDGEAIFQAGQPPSSALVSPPASIWHLVPVPSQLNGRTLSLILTSSVGTFAGTLNPVVIGQGHKLVLDLLSENAGLMLIVLFLFVTGLLSILAFFLVRRLPDSRLLYLGLFALIIGTWLFSEARLMQLVFGNRFIVGSISYLMVALMPVPLILYIRVAVLPQYKRILLAVTGFFMLVFVVIITLQLTGTAAFIETALFTNTLNLLTVIGLIAALVRDAWLHKNRAARILLIASSILILAALFEILSFLTANFDAVSTYSRIGIVIFFLIMVSGSIRSINHVLDNEREARLLARLAYEDYLTGSGNRLAFERDIQKRIEQEETQDFRLVLLDINNLKQINDQFGHQAGDQAIRACMTALVEAVGDQGICYRTGGDEFACIVDDISPTLFRQIHDRVRKNLSDQAEQLPFRLAMAAGSAVYDASIRTSFASFNHHVDQLMYAEKKNMKNVINES